MSINYTKQKYVIVRFTADNTSHHDLLSNLGRQLIKRDIIKSLMGNVSFSLWFIFTEQRKQRNLLFQIVRETTFFNATFVDSKF